MGSQVNYVLICCNMVQSSSLMLEKGECTMISTKSMLRPQFVLLALLLLQFSVYWLYSSGTVTSFKIFFVSRGYDGYMHMAMFYLIPVMITSFLRKTPEHKLLTLMCVKEKRVLTLAALFLAVAFFGMMRVGARLFSEFGLMEVLRLSFNGQSRDYLVTGSGNTIMSIFGLQSLILLATLYQRKSRMHNVILIANLGIMFMYSSMLNSRILFLQGLFFFIIILFRRHRYAMQFSLRKAVAFATVLLIFLVVTSGYRDYKQEGQYYTSSVLEWGMKRILDYSISTTNYALEVTKYADVSDTTFPANTMPIMNNVLGTDSALDLVDLSKETGSLEYTNKGAFSQIFMDMEFYYLLFMIFLGFVYAVFWKKFDKGRLIGYLMYPIIFYNIMESSRIYYLGTIEAEIMIILALTMYVLTINCYKHEIAPSA